MMKPSAVSEKATRKIASTVNPKLASVKCTPNAGAKTRKMSPCAVAKVAPPSTLPSTMTERLTGATRTESRNPSLRSSITDIMVQMAVKSTIMIRDPADDPLAQYDDGAAYRRHQDGKQEPFFAVLNHRHHGKDGCEEHDHDQSAREEIVEIVRSEEHT